LPREGNFSQGPAKQQENKNTSMKKIKSAMAAALVLGMAAAAFTLSGCSSSTQSDQAAQSSDPPAAQGAKSAKYTCSMHPEVVQDKPGDCPKCGMKLVEKK
jgi:hypothetical protein